MLIQNAEYRCNLDNYDKTMKKLNSLDKKINDIKLKNQKEKY